MKGRVLIIGAGGVGAVAAHKCAQLGDVFKDILLASRTLPKCERTKQQIKEKTGRDIRIASVDAGNVPETVEMINQFKPDVVINAALPYQNLAIMDACLATGVHYIDTACSETPAVAGFEYGPQWDYHDAFAAKGIMAVLGCGFDPGVTNVFAAYAQKHWFDEIHAIDILDCNAGNHGRHFATNFNTEINIREIMLPARYWERGRWITAPSIIDDDSIHFPFNYPVVGSHDSYLLYHEEMESLVRHIKGLRRIRFWMTFSENYLAHLKVLKNIGMTRVDTLEHNGHEVVPIQFLQTMLPEPASLAPNYTGKTVIGNIMSGIRDGKPKSVYVHNVCDHAACYQEIHSQAISYTSGVPAMIAAMLIVSGTWHGAGVFNVEQLDPDAFMDKLNVHGLPWQVMDHPPLPDQP